MAAEKKSQINNRTIIRNSMFLYVRMLLLMVINFFSVRVILEALGVEDYGIYNVVGGIVAMFSFLNGSLTTASQRYFSMEIATGDHISLNKIFSLNMSVFSMLTVGIIILAETAGLWFLNNKLTIPADRLVAANWVYQFSLLAFLFNMLSIPYNALIVSYEKMKAFAWIGLAEGFGRLAVAIGVMYAGGDKLVFYSVLMMALSLAVVLVYRGFCLTRFGRVARFRLVKDWQGIKGIFSFSGWHFLGTMSVVVRSAGINLLINVFFNPAVNAARAIGYQVENVVSQFSNNYFTAVKPQMYKAYSAGETDELFKLIFRSTILSMFLISLLLFPICFNTEFLLSLWLEDVPDGAALFAQLALVNCLIEATGNPTIAPALAYGRIRRYEIVTSAVTVMNLPVSYVTLKLGAPAAMTVVVSIVISLISVVVRAAFLRGMIGFPMGRYLMMFARTMAVSGIIFLAVWIVVDQISNGWIALLISGSLSVALVSVLYLFVVVDSGDRQMVVAWIRNKFKK